jgi:soluble lytic murein transglycosylase
LKLSENRNGCAGQVIETVGSTIKRSSASIAGVAIRLAGLSIPMHSAAAHPFTICDMPCAHAETAITQRLAQRSGTASTSISPLDLSAVKRALDLIRRGKADEAAALTKTITQPVAAKLIEWAILRTGGSEGKGFERYASFLRTNSHWPSTGLFRRRAEEALWDERISADLVRAFFTNSQPTSPKGQFALAKAYLELGRHDAAQELVRKAWREGSFSPPVETQVSEEFGDLLNETDHKVRLAMRLYDNDGEAAMAVAKRLAPADMAIAKAGLAVNRKAANAQALLNAVPAEAKKDASYVFANIQLLRKDNKITQAAQLLLSAPRDPEVIHNPDEWWVLRRDIGRMLVDLKDARKGYRIISEAALPAKENFRAEHHFLAGWIALSHLNEPKTARTHFAEMAQVSKTPLVKARAAYWQGRAADAMGQQAEARAHYQTGAEFGLTYYGQLARARLGLADIALRDPPASAPVAHNDLVRATEILYALGERDLIVTIMADVADRTQDIGTLRALADVSARNEDARAMVQLGRDAVEHGLAFDSYAFPTAGVPSYESSAPQVEPSLVYAIIRQESAFNPKTISSANALGLMQVTPDTGRAIAKKFSIPFDQKRLLEDSGYNVQIGAAELGDLVQYYRGSYLLAFAAYNAGRGRVNQWIERYGDPRNRKVDPVDWIERIPFAETRDYVQRVMENVQVYRARLGNGSKLLIESDLRRGVSAN